MKLPVSASEPVSPFLPVLRDELYDRPHRISLPNSMQILFISRNTNLYDELCLLLKQKGYTLQQQLNSRFALEHLVKQRFDLVILELDLSGFIDLEFCVELRKNSRVPLIVLLHSQQAEKLVKALELGADAVITVPSAIKEIEARIIAVLRRSFGSYVTAG